MFRKILARAIAISTLSLLAACAQRTPAAPTQIPSLPPTPTLAPQPTETPLPAPSEPPLPPTQTATPTQAVDANALPHLAPGSAVTLTRLQMLSPQAGWALGHTTSDSNDHVLRTRDGGNTWSDVTPPQAAGGAAGEQVATAFFLDENHAWAAYAASNNQPPSTPPVVWRTLDGGASWTASQGLPLPGLVDIYRPSDLDFSGSQTGWMLAHLGSGMGQDNVAVLGTSDGGESWERVVDPDLNNLPMSCLKTGLALSDAHTGWVTGDCQGNVPGVYLYRSGDGGHTWQAQTLPAPAGTPDLFTNEANACAINSLAFTSSTVGKMAVVCSRSTSVQAQGWLYATADGGQSWSASTLPFAYGALQFLDASAGWFLGLDNQLYGTTDGGKSWPALKAVAWHGQPDFVSPTLGWVIAAGSENWALVQSTDGGKNWEMLKPVIGP